MIFRDGLNSIIKNTINEFKDKGEFIEFIKEIGNVLKDILNNTKKEVHFLFDYGLKPIIDNTINEFKDKGEFIEFIKEIGNVLKDISNNNKEDVIGLFYWGLRPIIENTINEFKNKGEFIEFIKEIGNVLKDIPNNTEKHVGNLLGYGLFSLIENTINKFGNKREFIEFLSFLKDIANKNISKINEKYESIYFKSIYQIYKKTILDLNNLKNKNIQKLIIQFYNKIVRNSTDNIEKINKLEKFDKNIQISNILIYYLKYRQKSLVDFINNISIIKELNLEIDIEKEFSIKTEDDFSLVLIPFTQVERLKPILYKYGKQINYFYCQLIDNYFILKKNL